MSASIRECTVLAMESLTLMAEICKIFSTANLTTKFTINRLLRRLLNLA